MGKNYNRAKPGVRQIPQKTGPENWRKQQANEKKKLTGLRKNQDRLEHQLTFLTPNSKIATGLVFLLLFSMIIPQVKATSYPDKSSSDPSTFRPATLSLEERIQAKIQIDPNIPSSLHSQLKCDQIPGVFKGQHLSMKHVERVLDHPNFGIMCTSNEKITKETGSSAFFNNLNTKIWTAYPFDTCVMNHEFLHAYFYFGHNDGPCRFPDEKSLFLPFFPKNEEQYIHFKKTLQKGYSRLDNFKGLLTAEEQGKKLSAVEKRILDKYRDAAKDCPDTFYITQPPEQYDNMIARGWKPGRGARMPLYGAVAQILNVEKINNKTVTQIKIKDIAFLIANIPNFVREKVEKEGLYKNVSENIKLAEMHAYTYQGLSPKAEEEFFPELKKMVEESRLECFPKETEEAPVLSNPGL